MTEATSEKLAQDLDKVSLPELAIRARKDEFHDFKSPHDFPEIFLVGLLHEAAQGCPDANRMAAILNIRQGVMEGRYDASKEESDAWAASPDGQEAFRKLHRGE